MKEIFVSPGYVAFVDDADFALLNARSWWSLRHRHGGRETTYAYTRIDGNQIGMHNLLVPHADHINNDGLDNQRHNLRTATQSQNLMNTRKTLSPTSSKYKGVCWHKRAKKWMASIKINRTPQYLGLFIKEIDAAKAYDAAAKHLFGSFAHLNFKEIL